MSMRSQGQPHKSWYREPWPWLLMSGPVAVVIAGIATAWIAVKHEDGLVADDYYKQGLVINQVLRRDTAASALALSARVVFGERRVRVFLASPAMLPGEVVLRLVHRTRAGLDREARLQPAGEGWYEGELPAVAGGRWHVLLEDGERNWRLTGDWNAAVEEGLQLSARPLAGDGR
jgi:hypothetical protein